MVALTEQSVCTSLPKARPSVHMLPNSPFVAASVAVARPSTKAPARAELMYALMLISYQVGDLRRSRKVRFVRLAGSSVRPTILLLREREHASYPSAAHSDFSTRQCLRGKSAARNHE